MRRLSVSRTDHRASRPGINGGLSITGYQCAIVLAAIIAAYLPMSSGWVERFYSTGLYPVVQHAVTAGSNRLPFALFDVLVAVLIATWIALAWRDTRQRNEWVRAVARVSWRSIVWSALAYLVFLITWGFNYRRAHFPQKLPY